jgi:hypothetical protein
MVVVMIVCPVAPLALSQWGGDSFFKHLRVLVILTLPCHWQIEKELRFEDDGVESLGASESKWEDKFAQTYKKIQELKPHESSKLKR